MKLDTIKKADKAVDWMIDNKVGIMNASKEWNISVGSIHKYIYDVLRFEDDEKFRRIKADLNMRYKKVR